jgi:hypothetical protein
MLLPQSFSFLATTLLTNLILFNSLDKISALDAEERKLSIFSSARASDCDSYQIDFPEEATGKNNLWNGKGSDSEWINVDNWARGYLPGVTIANKVTMAGTKTKATVHCPATYMRKKVGVKMRNSASLDIKADLNLGDKLILKTKSKLTQSSESKVTVGKKMVIHALYSISEQAQLSAASAVALLKGGELKINGDSTIIQIGGAAKIQGQLSFVLGPSGSGTFEVDGALQIRSSTATITIDAAAYSSGAGKIQLIKSKSVTNKYRAKNVSITGAEEGLTAKVKVEADGVYLQLGTKSPVTKSPVAAPTASPVSAPTTTSQQPVKSPAGETTIILSASGVNAISSNGICPAQDTSSIVIDGAAYTAGAGTITLYDCSIINNAFDLMNIKLRNFQEGLWFEIIYKNKSIDLVIKSLDDYSEYWNRVRRTYTGDYPTQTSTAHFPNFSWETIPTWIRYRKNINTDTFDDDELISIANNNHLSWYGLGTPEHVVDMATRIKNQKASHTFLMYWNAQSYWGMDIDTFSQAWLDCGNQGTGGRCSYNHSKSAMRNWWVNHAKLMDNYDVIDGVFTDNTRSSGVADQSTTIKSNMIKRLAEEMPTDSLKVGNYLRQYDNNGNRWRMPYVDGTYFENQHKSIGLQPKHEGIVVSMQLAREASWKKKLVLWSGGRRNCGCATYPSLAEVPEICKGFNTVDEEPVELITQDLHKSLGEFFMLVEEFSYFNFHISPDAGCERWRWDSSGLAEFSKPLGKPLGPPLKMGNNFSRHFEHLSVKVNIETEETTFNWY